MTKRMVVSMVAIATIIGGAFGAVAMRGTRITSTEVPATSQEKTAIQFSEEPMNQPKISWAYDDESDCLTARVYMTSESDVYDLSFMDGDNEVSGYRLSKFTADDGMSKTLKFATSDPNGFYVACTDANGETTNYAAATQVKTAMQFSEEPMNQPKISWAYDDENNCLTAEVYMVSDSDVYDLSFMDGDNEVSGYRLSESTTDDGMSKTFKFVTSDPSDFYVAVTNQSGKTTNYESMVKKAKTIQPSEPVNTPKVFWEYDHENDCLTVRVCMTSDSDVYDIAFMNGAEEVSAFRLEKATADEGMSKTFRYTTSDPSGFYVTATDQEGTTSRHFFYFK